MNRRVSAAEFYTASLGSMLILTVVVIGLMFLYDKVIKKDDEKLLTQK